MRNNYDIAQHLSKYTAAVSAATLTLAERVLGQDNSVIEESMRTTDRIEWTIAGMLAIPTVILTYYIIDSILRKNRSDKS